MLAGSEAALLPAVKGEERERIGIAVARSKIICWCW
jgi:hypothetical protein